MKCVGYGFAFEVIVEEDEELIGRFPHAVQARHPGCQLLAGVEVVVPLFGPVMGPPFGPIAAVEANLPDGGGDHFQFGEQPREVGLVDAAKTNSQFFQELEQAL